MATATAASSSPPAQPTSALPQAGGDGGSNRVASASSASPQGIRQVACKCLNIRVNYHDAPSAQSHEGQLTSVKLAEAGTSVSLPFLVGRDLINLPAVTAAFAVPALRCLNCSTCVYAVEKALPSGPTRSVGFKANTSASASSNSPNRQKASPAATSRDLTVLKPQDGIIYLLPDCLDEEAIRTEEQSTSFSPIYGVSIIDDSTEPSSASASTTEAPASASDPSTDSNAAPPMLAQTRQQRHSSYGQFAPITQYGLQGLPNHLLISPPDSPRRSPRNSIVGLQSVTGSAGTQQQNSSASVVPPSSSSHHYMASQLDSAALEKLKQWRSTAEQEIHDVIRAKRRELDAMILRAKNEAEAIFDRARSAPPPNASLTIKNASVSALQNSPGASGPAGIPSSAGRSRDSSVPAPENPTAIDRSSSKAVASELSSPSSLEEHHSLSSDAFQRIPPRNADNSTSNNVHNMSSSLSALSASFALRGRDGPTSMDDWAQKRRLKARYPEGDHSVMTSAATSAANSYSEPPSEADVQDEGEEEESRGRGRERGARAGPGSSRDRHADNKPSQNSNLGTTSAPPGTVARPSMAPSSLTSPPHKSVASTSLDLGDRADQGTPKSSATLGGLASPSAQINLRPRNPPPKSAEPLKPATRSTKRAGEGAGTPNKKDKAKSRGESGAEKKVAFAETTDEAAAAQAADFGDSDDEELGEPVDERGTGVFDIDEDLDDEGGEADEQGIEQNGSRGIDDDEDDRGRIDALVGAAEKIGLGGVETGREDEEDRRGRGRESSLTEEELGGVRASVGAQYAGSFSALAASLQHDRDWSSAGRTRRANVEQAEPGFDPASLRLDGRVAPSPVSLQNAASADRRSSSRTRGGSAARDLSEPATSDYDADAGRDSSRDGRSGRRDDSRGSAGGGWDRKGTSIGYRTTIGDTELRLSGLLAPHAPSHRRLWGNARRKTEKYILDEDEENYEEDDETETVRGKGARKQSGGDQQQWTAWQKRAQEIDQRHRAKQDAERKGDSNLAQSVPVGHQGDAGRASTSWMPAPSMAVGLHHARQVPINVGGSSSGRGNQGSTVYDATSGFDREPKTSLPYQERKMVPSLRKATRLGAFDMQRKPSLPTIPDADTEESSPAIKTEEGEGEKANKGSTAKGIAIQGASSKVSASTTAADAEDARLAGSLLPGSQVKRGFALPSGTPAAGQGAAVQIPGAGARPPAAAEQSSAAAAKLSPVLASSGHLTPSSVHSGRSGSSPGRRSPRPPYVAPPPPSSTTIVLEPDPKNRPGALDLFKVPANTQFAYNEEGEEEETDWTKVLKFMHRVERLKVNKRTGWLHHRVPRAESIADHMYRMAMLAMLCPNDVDIGKCVLLALVHDLAEAEVGDLTPLDGVPKEEKTRREAAALEYLVHDLLGSSPAALRLEALWHEYEDRQSLESKLVKDLDRFELILQAVEYEGAHDIVDLQPFFSCAGDITHPRIRKWTIELAKEREAMWKQKLESRFAYEQSLPDDPAAA